MAEYLSIGPSHPYTDAVMRDAALNGDVPSVEQMSDRPDLFFPYRFGESLWQYVGRRWGDEVIGEILLTLEEGLAFKGAKAKLNLKVVLETWKELPKYWLTSIRSTPCHLIKHSKRTVPLRAG